MKTIKFDLPIDGKKVSSIEEFQEHFTTEIISHFRKGVLERWLESRPDSTFLPEVRKLAGNDEAQSDDVFALRELCRIFGFDADEAVIEAAVAEPSGIPGMRLRTQGMRPHAQKGVPGLVRRHDTLPVPTGLAPIGNSGFPQIPSRIRPPDAPTSSDPDEWSAYLVEFINHCRVVVEVLKSCPDRAFAETLAAQVSDHVDYVSMGPTGMTREEFDGVAAEAHVEDVRPPIRMEPVRHDVRTPGRTRVSELRWVSEGAIEQAGDVDRWCFTVLRPGEVTVQTNGNLDTVGVLEDCFGDRIDSDDDSGRGSNFKIVRTLDPGTYYIRVSASRTATGGYTLNVRHNTRPARTDSRDDPELSTASLVVNRSISQARAIAGRHRQEVLRSLSKAHLRELRGIVGDPDLSEAEWIRAWPIIQRYPREGARAAGIAADGESTDNHRLSEQLGEW